jgi:hypothetical protein
MGWTEYASRMCDRINATGVRGKFDGFAMHAYGASANQDLNAVLQEFETATGSGYQTQIGLLDSKGFSTYPVYITEWNRYTGSSTDEWVSAQFLYTALTRMNTWNQSHHAVVCACWFVYPSDYGWGEYSIRGLKSNDTYDHDLWHAFKYACTLGLPAGVIAPPWIECSATSFVVKARLGHSAASQTFTVRNAGGGTLDYTITDDRTWISVSPATGSSTSEADTITVALPTASLTAGTYTGTVTVNASGAGNSPRTVVVTLRVFSGADFDEDFDIDLGDFSFFQACFNGPDRAAALAECPPSDFDGDRDVDLSDFAAFQACFNGPNRLPSSSCSG